MSRVQLLGQNIKKYRLLKGLRQIDLAVALGFSEDYISRVELGKKYMSLRKLFELADILEIDFNKLVDFK